MQVGLALNDPATAIEEARAAEERGFDLLGCGEHLFFHGPMPNAFVTLAAAAGATRRIRLVSSITLLPLYPAALAAKLAATLDQVSGGRFELGVGAGGEYPAEFVAAGVDPRERFRRLDEGLETLRHLFSGETVEQDGEFTTLPGVALDPPPRRPGGPPLWMGGRKDGSMRRAGRWADVWMPYLVTPGQVRDGLGRIAEVAHEHARPPGAVTGALLAWTCVDPDAGRARRRGVAAISRTYDQDFAPLADRYLLLGDPDAVLDRLTAYAAAGVDQVIVQVAADAADRAAVLDTLAEHVLPAARDL